MALDILTIGDSNIDLFMKIPDSAGLEETSPNSELPKICFYHGSKINVESFSTSVAGNAINVALGTKLLGLSTGVYSEIGDDTNANRIIAELDDMGVDTRFCIKNPGTETDLHTVIVFGGERTIFSYHGKRTYSVQKWISPKFIYYTSIGYGFETFQRYLIGYLSDAQNTSLVFSPGTMQLRSPDALNNVLKVTSILFVNKEEAEKLTGLEAQTEIEVLHKKLLSMGPKMTVITEGENGASVFDGKKIYSQQIFTDNRPLMDKTGAGDAFAAGFLSAIIYGKNLSEALKWGVVNSGSNIKVIGASDGMLKKEDLEKIVAKI